MSDERGAFSVGSRVRVSERCFDRNLRGAIGVIQPKMASSANASDGRIVWVEFEPWIQREAADPIEAAEIDTADLEPT
jgi:hypothetical protein